MDLNTATPAQVSARLGELATIVDGWEPVVGERIDESIRVLGAAVREVGLICAHITRARMNGWTPLAETQVTP